MQGIALESSDGEVFVVDVKVVNFSKVLRTMLQSSWLVDDGKPVVLSNITGAILRMVLDWIQYHQDDPQGTEAAEKSSELQEWDANFVNVDQDTLFKLIMAAYFLKIKGLVDVTCKAVANSIKGKTTAELREMFNLNEKNASA
ncbi:S-phase kinase-associated protein 1-like [Drosophila pseudoobscura]|uniref:S-phase kinase-associated protein 1-like n=1 Tax=Drosophila pseudoobscura pseudoobscura TaxID=46245 RepID=A0A6I8UX71_DROPS|nr:S-phase kinase-associated protein 1 [Drosophila pseudoobscura]